MAHEEEVDSLTKRAKFVGKSFVRLCEENYDTPTLMRSCTSSAVSEILLRARRLVCVYYFLYYVTVENPGNPG